MSIEQNESMGALKVVEHGQERKKEREKYVSHFSLSLLSTYPFSIWIR
jgi:hypothetical protein